MAVTQSDAADRPFYTIRIYAEGSPNGVFVDVSDDVLVRALEVIST